MSTALSCTFTSTFLMKFTECVSHAGPVYPHLHLHTGVLSPSCWHVPRLSPLHSWWLYPMGHSRRVATLQLLSSGVPCPPGPAQRAGEREQKGRRRVGEHGGRIARTHRPR